MTRANRIAALVATAVLVAGCGGGSGAPAGGNVPSGVDPGFGGKGFNGSVTLPVGHTGKGAKKGELKIVVTIPPYTRRHGQGTPILKAGLSPRRRPKYISPATKSMTVAVSGEQTQVFNLTPQASNCTSGSGGGLTCTESAFFPSGEQSITITLFDKTDGNGNALSDATTTVNIKAGGVTDISVTLDGIAASAQVLLSGGSAVSATEGTPAMFPVTVNAFDAAGELIVSPGHYDDSTVMTLSDSDSTGATQLSSTNVSGPGSTISLSYNGGNISSATITVKISGVAQPNPAVLTVMPPVTPTPSPTPEPVASPTSLSFSDGNPQTFVVTEIGYAGALTESDTCNGGSTPIASVSPSTANGPSATFTVTPLGGGTCTVTVADSADNSASVSVSVNGGIIIIDQTPVASPTSLTFDTAASQTFAIKEKDYTGTLAEADNCAGVASVSPTSASGPQATFTVTPIGGGSCAIGVTDDQEDTANVSVSVSGGGVIVNQRTGKHVHGGR